MQAPVIRPPEGEPPRYQPIRPPGNEPPKHHRIRTSLLIAAGVIVALLVGFILIGIFASPSQPTNRPSSQPTAAATPRPTATPKAATPTPRPSPSQKELAAAYAAVVQPLMTAQAKDMQTLSSDCSALDLQACDASAEVVQTDARAIQQARTQHPAPTCLQAGDQKLGQAEDVITGALEHLQTGIEQNDPSEVDQATNELNSANTLMQQSADAFTNNSC